MPPEEANQVLGLASDIGELLAGYAPDTQGAALAEATARWLAAHMSHLPLFVREELQEELRTMHVSIVREMLAALNEPSE